MSFCLHVFSHCWQEFPVPSPSHASSFTCLPVLLFSSWWNTPSSVFVCVLVWTVSDGALVSSSLCPSIHVLTLRCRYEDPRDTAAIMFAEKNMGDYKLKSDKTYVVPDNLRVNAEKKLRQMVLLEESIFTLKMVRWGMLPLGGGEGRFVAHVPVHVYCVQDYNERFLALRDLKQRMVKYMTEDLEEIQKINEVCSASSLIVALLAVDKLFCRHVYVWSVHTHKKGIYVYL